MSVGGQTRRDQEQRLWLFIPALIVLVPALLVAHAIDNMYVFGVGGILAILILSPLWWGYSRFLLAALVLYLPFEDALVPPVHPGSSVVRGLPDLVLLIMFIVRAAIEVQRRRPFFGTPLDWPVLFVLAVSLISMLLNHTRPILAVEGPYLFLRYALLFYLVASSGFSFRDVRLIIRLLVWAGILQSVFAITQFVLINTSGYQLFGEPFIEGTMSHANVLGAFLALVCIIAVATYSRDSGLVRPGELMVLLGVACAAIVLSLSRQSLIALVLGVATIAVVKPQARDRLVAVWRSAASAILGGAAGFAAIAAGVPILDRLWLRISAASQTSTPVKGVSHPTVAATATPAATAGAAGGTSVAAPPVPTATATPVPNQYNSTLSDKASQLSSLSAFIDHLSQHGGRLYEILRAGPEILKRSPLFGLGPGTFGNQATFNDKQFYASLHVPDLVLDPVHDYLSDVEWMTVFGQLGILGFLGFLWIFGAIGLIGWRAARHASEALAQRLGVVCVAFVPMFLFLGWTGPNFELRPVSVLPWFFAGLTVSLVRGETAQDAVETEKLAVVRSSGAAQERPDPYAGWEAGPGDSLGEW